jgi:hypothetical protein
VTVSWSEPTRRLVAELRGGGLGEVWTLLYAAAQATLRMALLPGLDEDLDFTESAMDLREAVEQLEWDHPGLPAVALAVDLGEPRLDEIAGCRAAIGQLLTAALEVAGRLLDDGGDLDVADVLVLARVMHLATQTHLRVTGRLP